MLTSPEPLNDTEPTTSPDRAIVLAVCSVVAVEALPESAAVIVLAEKLPSESRNTRVDPVFRVVAFEAIEYETFSPAEPVIERPLPETATSAA